MIRRAQNHLSYIPRPCSPAKSSRSLCRLRVYRTLLNWSVVRQSLHKQCSSKQTAVPVRQSERLKELFSGFDDSNISFASDSNPDLLQDQSFDENAEQAGDPSTWMKSFSRKVAGEKTVRSSGRIAQCPRYVGDCLTQPHLRIRLSSTSVTSRGPESVHEEEPVKSKSIISLAAQEQLVSSKVLRPNKSPHPRRVSKTIKPKSTSHPRTSGAKAPVPPTGTLRTSLVARRSRKPIVPRPVRKASLRKASLLRKVSPLVKTSTISKAAPAVGGPRPTNTRKPRQAQAIQASTKTSVPAPKSCLKRSTVSDKKASKVLFLEGPLRLRFYDLEDPADQVLEQPSDSDDWDIPERTPEDYGAAQSRGFDKIFMSTSNLTIALKDKVVPRYKSVQGYS